MDAEIHGTFHWHWIDDHFVSVSDVLFAYSVSPLKRQESVVLCETCLLGDSERVEASSIDEQLRLESHWSLIGSLNLIICYPVSRFRRHQLCSINDLNVLW